MEIDRRTFDRMLELTTQQQAKELSRLGFDLFENADEYYGIVIPSDNWNAPDRSVIEDFFERIYDDHEAKMTLYDKTHKLSSHDSKLLKDFIISDAGENEYYPDLFIGHLTSNGKSLVVVVERTGGCTDCEAKLAGVFSDMRSALQRIGGEDYELIS
ncbi:hypothetical protein QM467_15845 [Rhodoblastus sp. 17X3]|uniref:hypothetical protein n=1 Tax=Rhodoblastus sp. 17X3 TaxID=3047026 RepID=UPI0024B82D21|nr:hypothetical protein [Rhodoblastus sp. 17X3]MDI9849528.1 hypothetical protein [Rhodoblastus sp. 17X3]